ncbi:MAG TPA: polyphosphate kinase 1 [Planctomycetota bacterium]|nr:polyphosphate kinase 1 [Planctomycetota bacterium]
MSPLATEPGRFLNRELAWVAFNRRVLEEALDATNPLLERVKFLAIVSSNLDEFFEVRVAGLKRQVEASVQEPSPDGLTPSKALEEISVACHRLVEEQYAGWRALRADLEGAGIRILNDDQLSPTARAWVSRYFDEVVGPVLTPLAIDPAHPFPQLLSKSLNLAVVLRPQEKRPIGARFAIVQVPRVLPRLVRLPQEGATHDYMFLMELIRAHLGRLFPGHQVAGGSAFRVTRNADIEVATDEAADLLEAIEAKLRRRRRAEPVRIEMAASTPGEVVQRLLSRLKFEKEDLYLVDGPVNLARLMELYAQEDRPELKWPTHAPSVPVEFPTADEAFARLRQGDVLLHHPFESFAPVIDFLESAAEDPAVLAIKMTLYRTSGDSPVLRALMAAAEAGKQVTVLVELKARFDEENNIRWARTLEGVGVHVVYGLVGLKTHCKVILVVRREANGVRRYCHLATGNYNSTTARAYTDVGLFTANEEIGRDVADVFNLLTGYAQPTSLRRLLVAPFGLHEGVLLRIRRETANAQAGKPAGITAKMNALVDPQVIDALYEASSAGVKVDLIVRGICCLRPGLPGLSERITVRGVVDRFLEHTRIFVFENGGDREVWLGSADWMPRNFFGRVEACFPVLDPALRARIVDEILATYLRDDQRARILQPDGTWTRAAKPVEGEGFRAQFELLKLAKSRGPQLPPAPARPERTARRRRRESADAPS